MARLKASEKQQAARQGLEKLIDSGQLSRAQERKAKRLLGNKRAMRRFAEDVELSILRDEGDETTILDKLTAIIDWIIANWDKISKIISFISVLFPA